MAARISLALTLHNHQPIGNFGWVMADVCDRAYAPMVEALHRHPTIRVGLHYSGPLLEWLERERPAVLDGIVELAGRGQVELLGGGLHEPILVALPEIDRREQLARMADRIEALSGVRPRGAWLAERIWEPDLPRCLADTGYDWTIVDDAHFRAAGLPDDAAWSPWLTEDQGHPVAVFATDQWLRYRIPFGTPDEVVERLRGEATYGGERLATMGDDGEKFGAWPTTYEHCWGRAGWVDRFFEALEANHDWLTTTTPSAWLEANPPRGLAYLPTASYAEMGEWAMAADDALAFAAALHDAVEAGRPEAQWLRGAPWRSFLVKYREANDAHKQMLRASAAVHPMAAGAARDRALDHLHRGQSNDSYWHGLFGGLYLADLRVAALRHLIAAQDLADSAARYPTTAVVADLDMDGRPDVLLADVGQVVTIDLDDGAGIGAWDLRAARYPVAAVLRRRPEAYHAKLRDLESKSARTMPQKPAETLRDPGTPATIHELVVAKDSGLAEILRYDDHERRLGLVRLFAPDASPEAVARAEAKDLGDFVDGAFSVVALDDGRLEVVRDGAVRIGRGMIPVRAHKTIQLTGDRRSPTLALELTLENRSDAEFRARIGLEFPTMLLGGGGNPAAWWEVGGQRWSHDSSGTAAGVAAIAKGNDYLGLRIDIATAPSADAWWAPIETVSNSESGFERAYQGNSLLLSWSYRLEPGERFEAQVQLTATIQRDLAEDEP